MRVIKIILLTSILFSNISYADDLDLYCLDLNTIVLQISSQIRQGTPADLIRKRVNEYKGSDDLDKQIYNALITRVINANVWTDPDATIALGKQTEHLCLKAGRRK